MDTEIPFLHVCFDLHATRRHIIAHILAVVLETVDPARPQRQLLHAGHDPGEIDPDERLDQHVVHHPVAYGRIRFFTAVPTRMVVHRQVIADKEHLPCTEPESSGRKEQELLTGGFRKHAVPVAAELHITAAAHILQQQAGQVRIVILDRIAEKSARILADHPAARHDTGISPEFRGDELVIPENLIIDLERFGAEIGQQAHTDHQRMAAVPGNAHLGIDPRAEKRLRPVGRQVFVFAVVEKEVERRTPDKLR